MQLGPRAVNKYLQLRHGEIPPFRIFFAIRKWTDSEEGHVFRSSLEATAGASGKGVDAHIERREDWEGLRPGKGAAFIPPETGKSQSLCNAHSP